VQDLLVHAVERPFHHRPRRAREACRSRRSDDGSTGPGARRTASPSGSPPAPIPSRMLLSSLRAKASTTFSTRSTSASSAGAKGPPTSHAPTSTARRTRRSSSASSATALGVNREDGRHRGSLAQTDARPADRSGPTTWAPARTRARLPPESQGSTRGRHHDFSGTPP
jgi:hypothetical protein